MKYLLLIYGNQEKWDQIPAESWPQEIAKQDAFNRKYHETGELLGGYGLADAAAARLVRRKDGVPAVTDGPYLETNRTSPRPSCLTRRSGSPAGCGGCCPTTARSPGCSP
jgi:hypothetical protein